MSDDPESDNLERLGPPPVGYGEPDHLFESPWPECMTCEGTGLIVGPDEEDMDCPTCGGSGDVPHDYDGDDW